MRNDKCLRLLQFIRSPWKQVLESSSSRGASFNLSCFCASIAIFDRFGNFLLTWSTDNFPWEGCTVVGQVSKLHLRGSPALFAKARPIVMIFQMPQTYLDKKTNTEVGTKSFTSTWSTSHSPKPSSPLTALKWEITSLISFGPPP